MSITPGPWKANFDKHNGHGGISIGDNIATVYLASIHAPQRPGGEINHPDNSESRANARAISKVPEMIELLKQHNIELKQTIKDIGGCDHPVNICVCGLMHLAETTQNLLKEIEGK